MAFEIKKKMAVARDEHGTLRQLSHPTEPFFGERPAAFSAGAEPAKDLSARELADLYVRQMMPHYGLGESHTANLTQAAAEKPRAEPPQLRFSDEKHAARQATVSYTQTALGLPVWQSGLAIRLRGEPLGVIGSDSSLEEGLEDVALPPPDSAYAPETIDAATLRRLLALPGTPQIHETRYLIYRYDPHERGNAVSSRSEAPPTPAASKPRCPLLTPPPVDASLVAGRHYVVGEILFALELEGWGLLNWRAFIEPRTGSVLRIDALLSCVNGMVLLRDPLTARGEALPPNAPADALDALRSEVALPGIADTPGMPRELAGPYVRLTSTSAPYVHPPKIDDGGRFDFSVPTDEFAAVSGYYHCDRCFRLMEELGFDVPRYFDGTRFPVTVDHRAAIRGKRDTVNAIAPGNATSTGSDGFRFALLAADATVGMAVEPRVTWHEFGHALLWDQIHFPNFRFAHSPGDAIAAILNDPDSRAPDPGLTFPWTGLDRRHDRAPDSGYAWGGDEDDVRPVGHPLARDYDGYSREQILSSSLFRAYRAIGGGHADVEVRRAAAHRMVWLLLEAISALSPVAPPASAEIFLQTLIEADLYGRAPVGPPAFGVLHKVLRWAFEQQGMFQPSGAPRPVTGPGAAPDVDILIDDGRGGGYAEAAGEITEPPGLWCRRQPDGNRTHQAPRAGQPAYVYVAAGNRGAAPATRARARVAFKPNTLDDLWPDGWTRLARPNDRSDVANIAPGQEVILGPFLWPEPATAALFADIDDEDDRSIARSTFHGSCPAPLLAMLDNNAACRRVQIESLIG